MNKNIDCGMLLKQIHDATEKYANNKLREHGLTLSQMRCIQYIDDHGPSVPLKDLEHYFKVSQPTMVGIIKRLESKKLVYTIVSLKDARAKNAVLTEKGAKIVSKSLSESRQEEEQLLSSLSKPQADEFRNMLGIIAESMVKES